MKTLAIVAISAGVSVGVSVVAVIGVLIGIGVYQLAQLEKTPREEAEDITAGKTAPYHIGPKSKEVLLQEWFSLWNLKSGAEIIIAEAEPNPAGRDAGNEWITLYNPSSSDKDISNWIVKSTHGKPKSFPIPSGTIIGSCGYFKIEFPSQFLDNEAEAAILLDQNGAVIDQTPVFSDAWKNNIPSC